MLRVKILIERCESESDHSHEVHLKKQTCYIELFSLTLTNIPCRAGSPSDTPSTSEIRTVPALFQCQSQIVHKSLHFYSYIRRYSFQNTLHLKDAFFTVKQTSGKRYVFYSTDPVCPVIAYNYHEYQYATQIYMATGSFYYLEKSCLYNANLLTLKYIKLQLCDPHHD